MRLSLRVQLGLTIVLVTLAVLLLVLFSARRQLVEELYRFDGSADTTVVARASERLLLTLEQVKVTWAQWPGADSLLAGTPRPSGTELLLLSPAGTVMAASSAQLRGALFSGSNGAGTTPTRDRGVVTAPGSGTSPDRAVVITFRDGTTGATVRLLFDDLPRRELRRTNGRLAGIVYALRFRLPPGAQARRAGGLSRPSEPPGGTSADRLFRVLIAPLLFGALGSIVLLLFATSRALSPLRALTAATRRLAAGDRKVRVPVAGSTEVAALAESFNAMADSLERSEAVRRQMVSDVAHELRTPITNLRCRLEAMQDGLATPDEAEMRGLHDETLLLQRLVEDLQLLSLADAGRLPLHIARGDLREVAASALASFAAPAAVQGVELVLEPGSAVPAEFDAMRIGQVLRNLLANALAHTPRGGAVRVTAAVRDGAPCCEVRDSGGGIAPEHLPHVFDRFWRADAARTREQGGAGLGLAIVRELVELHGGDVRVTSVPGSGATFVVRLPAAGAPRA